ncbi:MAG: lamin tail domain-containing protein, partial [Bacteroidota bacterium]
MKRKTVLSLFLIIPLYTAAQFSDDFSDNNFTQDPTWMGQSEKFTVEDQVLRLNDTQAGQAFLATESSMISNTQWEFWVRLAFTPSNNNHPKIYLVSDSDNLAGPLNGYYIRIGKDGTDNKRLYFYRQTGETHTEIMAGTGNIATLGNNRLRIKVTRDNAGNWTFMADPAGSGFFLPQGEVFDNQHTSTQWFGINCFYTVSNASSFFFDDFYVGDIIPDITPPEINSIIATSENTLEIVFSKAVEPITSQNQNNYFVDKGIGAPVTAQRPEATPNKVLLTFAQDFMIGESYTLTVLNVMDFAGNTLAPYTGTFAWYLPQPFDVVFNEIMADPTPQVGLPPHEYVELYNTSSFDINLQGWILQHGTTQREIPFAILPSGSYIVLTTAEALPDLESFGNVIAIPGLSSTAFTNGGTTLTLYDNQLELISFVSYSDSWYGDPAKADGGWSLEKIDPYNFCSDADNWRASTDPLGGTPAGENSIRDENPDTIPPILYGAAWENPLQVTLYFSENMDETSLSDPSNYLVNNTTPLFVTVDAPDFTKATLMLAAPLESNTVYEAVLNEAITDCAGNVLTGNTALFADYEAQPYDVVFNEIMANPSPSVQLPNAKYLEFFNTTDFPIHLRGWKLTFDSSQQELPFIPIPPGGYAVISTPEGAAAMGNFSNVFAVQGLSTNFLTIGGLTLSLLSPQQTVISFASYHEGWYDDPSKANGGWSLEKIDPYNFCGGQENWKASVDSRGGTPGEINSVWADNPDLTSPLLLRAGYEGND